MIRSYFTFMLLILVSTIAFAQRPKIKTKPRVLPGIVDMKQDSVGGFPIAADSSVAMSPSFSNIRFEFDSSVIKISSYPVLDVTSAELRASQASVELDGFASSEGTAAYNLLLSKARAIAVRTYLIGSGVDVKRIKVKAYGETRPIADNATEEGRILNRRVEFKKR